MQKQRKRKKNEETNRRECSKGWFWILGQIPEAAPNEEEENAEERVNRE